MQGCIPDLGQLARRYGGANARRSLSAHLSRRSKPARPRARPSDRLSSTSFVFRNQGSYCPPINLHRALKLRPPRCCCSVPCVECSCHWPGCACCGYHTQPGAPAGAAGTWPLHASSTSPVQTVPALRQARRDAWRGAMDTATTRSVRHAERAKSTGRAALSTIATRQSRAARRGAPRPFRLSTAANAPAKHATFALRFTHARTRKPALKMVMHRHLHRLRRCK